MFVFVFVFVGFVRVRLDDDDDAQRAQKVSQRTKRQTSELVTDDERMNEEPR